MTKQLDTIALSVFRHVLAAVCEQASETLARSAFSTNIRERRDHSAALFTAAGDMVAHAAAIPVHLGSQRLAVAAALEALGDRWQAGDAILLNDPYAGGTHLPDLTVVTPVFDAERLRWIVSTRAHHADVGGATPGSFPLSDSIFAEGLRIPCVRVCRHGKLVEDVVALVAANSRLPAERTVDLRAQVAANAQAAAQLQELSREQGKRLDTAAAALIDYGERTMRGFIASLGTASASFTDAVEDDGLGNGPLPICCHIEVDQGQATIDFTGTAPATRGPLNANRAITLAAVTYAFHIVCRDEAESDDQLNAGTLRPLTLRIPPASLLDARFPRPVAAGNVETSQRIVDVVLGALAQLAPGRVPAASQGTMNNVALGGYHPDGTPFAYYETLGGGAGAGPGAPGASAIGVHMTNTRNTPIEALENKLPLRVRKLAIRHGSGGEGDQRGGDGLIRELEALAPCTLSLLSERRATAPYGLAGGGPGKPGANVVMRADGTEEPLPAKCCVDLAPGDVLRIETPGGGGWG